MMALFGPKKEEAGEGHSTESSLEKAEALEMPAKPEEAQEQPTAEQGDKYKEILSKVKDDKNVGSDEEVGLDAKQIDNQMTAEARVEKLVTLAMEKGVRHAVAVARQQKDFYVLDMFHDQLLEKFHEALVKKGLIREV